MSRTNVELYEALKPTIGEDAARMIAEVVPQADELATRADLERGLADLRAELRAEIHDSNTRTIKWLVGVFLPSFTATWGLLVAALLKT